MVGQFKLVDVITISGAEGICPEFIHLVDELFDSSRILLLSAPAWRQGPSGATKYELSRLLYGSESREVLKPMTICEWFNCNHTESRFKILLNHLTVD
jgi:hypothetical protein